MLSRLNSSVWPAGDVTGPTLPHPDGLRQAQVCLARYQLTRLASVIAFVVVHREIHQAVKKLLTPGNGIRERRQRVSVHAERLAFPKCHAFTAFLGLGAT